MGKNPKKCAPNFIPDFIFNDRFFKECCIVHDTAYEQATGKLDADREFLLCNLRKARSEPVRFWRYLNYVQGTLLFLLVLLLPFSYIIYIWNKIKLWRKK